METIGNSVIDKLKEKVWKPIENKKSVASQNKN